MKSIVLPTIEKFHVKLRLHDINGEYAEKVITIEEPVYNVRDTKQTKRTQSSGTETNEVASENNSHTNGETNEILTRKVKKKVHAFPRNGINQPLIPLGTTRGYIIGVLVATARTIGVTIGAPLNGILGWMQNGGVKVLPQWVALSAKDVSIVDFFVQEAKSKVYYENVKEAECEFDMEVTPKGGFTKDLVQELLKRGSGVGISPKRRGYYEVVEFS